TGLNDRRGPASTAVTLYEETEESIAAREKYVLERRLPPAPRAHPRPPPTQHHPRPAPPPAPGAGRTRPAPPPPLIRPPHRAAAHHRRRPIPEAGEDRDSRIEVGRLRDRPDGEERALEPEIDGNRERRADERAQAPEPPHHLPADLVIDREGALAGHARHHAD